MLFYFWTFLAILYGAVLQQVTLPRLLEPYREPLKRRWRQMREMTQRISKWLQALFQYS